MKQYQDLYNSLSKIRSIIFNLTQENRLNINELSDFNQAAAQAFESLSEINILMKKFMSQRKSFYEREKKIYKKAQNYHELLLIIGLNRLGIEKLSNLPYRFLQSIRQALVKHNQPITSAFHFDLIIQKYRWFLLYVERDLNNFRSVQLYKMLYRFGNLAIKLEAKASLYLIEKECYYIADNIRAGENEEELLIKIKNHWYGQLSTYNPIS